MWTRHYKWGSQTCMVYVWVTYHMWSLQTCMVSVWVTYHMWGLQTCRVYVLVTYHSRSVVLRVDGLQPGSGQVLGPIKLLKILLYHRVQHLHMYNVCMSRYFIQGISIFAFKRLQYQHKLIKRLFKFSWNLQLIIVINCLQIICMVHVSRWQFLVSTNPTLAWNSCFCSAHLNNYAIYIEYNVIKF